MIFLVTPESVMLTCTDDNMLKNNLNTKIYHNAKRYLWSAFTALCCYTLIFRGGCILNYTTDEIALSNKTKMPKKKFTFTKFKDILSKDFFSVDDSVLPISGISNNPL